MEHMDQPSTLYYNIRGIAAKRGHPLGKGTMWGQDFILEEELIYDQNCASALTFVEVLTLERHELNDCLLEHEEDVEFLKRGRNFYLVKHRLQAWANAIVIENNLSSVRTATKKIAFAQRKLKRSKSVVAATAGTADLLAGPQEEAYSPASLPPVVPASPANRRLSVLKSPQADVSALASSIHQQLPSLGEVKDIPAAESNPTEEITSDSESGDDEQQRAAANANTCDEIDQLTDDESEQPLVDILDEASLVIKT